MKQHFLFYALILCIAVVFVFQLNQFPFTRFPNWDHFWIDTMQVGKLVSLHEGLRWNQLPAINPYIGFGWNYLGDTTLLQSPILPLNWLVLWFSPENVLSFPR